MAITLNAGLRLLHTVKPYRGYTEPPLAEHGDSKRRFGLLKQLHIANLVARRATCSSLVHEWVGLAAQQEHHYHDDENQAESATAHPDNTGKNRRE